MNIDFSLINYFLHASLVVKCVMMLLVCASIMSWAFIMQRYFYYKDIEKSASKFEQEFWRGEDIGKLYLEENKNRHSIDGLSSIFHAGFKEFLRFRQQPGNANDTVINNTKRAMNVAQMRVQDELETHLSFLAMVGSTSPYVGLFGTVWGIMTAFQSLAGVQQATIAMVAPGIAEALIATALGLFAAIPAVIAYNRYVSSVSRLMNRFDAFQAEFTNILIRQTHPNNEPVHRMETY